MRTLKLREVGEAQGHTASKMQDRDLRAAAFGCQALVSCLDHVDCGHHVETLTLYFPQCQAIFDVLYTTTFLLLTTIRGGRCAYESHFPEEDPGAVEPA